MYYLCTFLKSVLLSRCRRIVHLLAGPSPASLLDDLQALHLEMKLIPILQGCGKNSDTLDLLMCNQQMTAFQVLALAMLCPALPVAG